MESFQVEMAKYVLGAVGGAVGLVAGNYLYEMKTSTPLPIEVSFQPQMKMAGINMAPVVSAITRIMPESMRLSSLVKQGAPKEARQEDWYDVFGTDPYTIEEVVPDKVWSVNYKFVFASNFAKDTKKGMALLGMDFSSEEGLKRLRAGAENCGQKEQVEEVIEKEKKLQALIEEKGKCPETIEACGPKDANMGVVKLNNGEVLLYSPVAIREEPGFADWLKKIGPVKYVVLGSSSHTLHIPSVIKSYPDAKYISAESAWMKLRGVEGWSKDRADVYYNRPDELEQLNKQLSGQGVQLHYVKGDVLSEAMMVIAHGSIMECDLVYTTNSGFFMGEEAEKSNHAVKLFKWCLCAKPTSPNGALPPYRFWFMDPTCALSPMNIMRPNKDGSSCTDMATSLRKILSEDFDQALGVHCGRMNREDFRETIDRNWQWLDGSSLLKNKSE